MNKEVFAKKLERLTKTFPKRDLDVGAYYQALGHLNVSDLDRAFWWLVGNRTEAWLPTPAEILEVVSRTRRAKLHTPEPEPEPDSDVKKWRTLNAKFFTHIRQSRGDKKQFSLGEWSEERFDAFLKSEGCSDAWIKKMKERMW
jgi:hypothetical protein